MSVSWKKKDSVNMRMPNQSKNRAEHRDEKKCFRLGRPSESQGKKMGGKLKGLVKEADPRAISGEKKKWPGPRRGRPETNKIYLAHIRLLKKVGGTFVKLKYEDPPNSPKKKSMGDIKSELGDLSARR